MILCKVTKVHKGVLRECCEAGVTEPHEECGVDLVKNAGVGAQCFVALEAVAALNYESLEFSGL